MRLTDELTARRLIYTHPTPGMPSLVVIDIPSRLAGDGLALGRYYTIVVETPEELAEFEAYLAKHRSHPGQPDLLDRRPSRHDARSVAIIEYAPGEAGWPYMLLCRWPSSIARQVQGDPELLARGAYTFEAFTEREPLVTMALGTRALLDGIDVDLILSTPRHSPNPRLQSLDTTIDSPTHIIDDPAS